MGTNRAVDIIAVGDIMLDTDLRPPAIVYHQPGFAVHVPAFLNYRPSFAIPFVNSERTQEFLKLSGVPLDGLGGTAHCAQSIALQSPQENGFWAFPLAKMRKFLNSADLVLGNLECPLTTRGRPERIDMCYRANPQFARALAQANFNVLSLANNHCLDYGEDGFLDTVSYLQQAGIVPLGAVIQAPQPITPVMRKNGLRIAFVAYNLVGPEITYAYDGHCGVVPLNPLTVMEDIRRLRHKADFILAAVHWGIENHQQLMPQLREIAHLLIDFGVDIVIGHHSHTPGPVERYKGGLIFYSLGNFIFGHTHSNWGDNVVARLHISSDRVISASLVPIATTGEKQYQPHLLSGAGANAILARIADVSHAVGTVIEVKDGCGYIDAVKAPRSYAAAAS